MFDQKTVHPAQDVDTFISLLPSFSLKDIQKLKHHVHAVERNLKEEEAKKAVEFYDEITYGSILLVNTLFSKLPVHAVVLNQTKFQLGFRCWFLNDEVEDVYLPRILKHERNEPYVPLQLKLDAGKRDRMPLPKAKEDLRQKYKEEYVELIKGE